MTKQIEDICEELQDLEIVIETAEKCLKEIPYSFGTEMTLRGWLYRRDQLNQKLDEELKREQIMKSMKLMEE